MSDMTFEFTRDEVEALIGAVESVPYQSRMPVLGEYPPLGTALKKLFEALVEQDRRMREIRKALRTTNLALLLPADRVFLKDGDRWICIKDRERIPGWTTEEPSSDPHHVRYENHDMVFYYLDQIYLDEALARIERKPLSEVLRPFQTIETIMSSDHSNPGKVDDKDS